MRSGLSLHHPDTTQTNLPAATRSGAAFLEAQGIQPRKNLSELHCNQVGATYVSLSPAERAVADKILSIKQEKPVNVIAIADTNRDPDDLAAFSGIPLLGKLGLIRLDSVILTQGDLQARTNRGAFTASAFDALGVNETDVCIGGDYAIPAGKESDHSKFHKHTLPESKREIHSNALEFIKERLTQLKSKGEKCTLVIIAGHTDLSAALADEEARELIKATVNGVSIMGGIGDVEDGIATADKVGYNNTSNQEASDFSYAELQKIGVPMIVIQKEAAYAAAVRPNFYEGISETGHPVGTYLHGIQYNALSGLFGLLVDEKIPGRDVAWFFKFFASLDANGDDKVTTDSLLANFKETRDFSPIFATTKNLFLYDPLTLLAAVEGLRDLLFTPVQVPGTRSEVLLIKDKEVANPDEARAALSAIGKLSLRGELPIKRYSADHFSRSGGTPKGYPEVSDSGASLGEWKIPDANYNPVRYESKAVIDNDITTNPKGWADPQDVKLVSRPLTSIFADAQFNQDGEPLNPVGRTGVSGRGTLGKWGENLAVDRILTRINPATNRIEMVAIQRADNTWAHPGGFVDNGEGVKEAVIRESAEEVGIEGDAGEVIYSGYVADPRNTDNAWIATVVFHRHLTDEEAKVAVKAGDDAKQGDWTELTPNFINAMYASHGNHVLYALDRLVEEFGDEMPREAIQQANSIMRGLKQ